MCPLYPGLAIHRLPPMGGGGDRKVTPGILRASSDLPRSLFNRVTLWSKEEQKLILIKQILEEAGIRTGKIIRSRNISGLPIYGKENLKMFTRRIGFRHPVKKAALAGKDAMAQP